MSRKRKISVLEDWSGRGERETTRYCVQMCGAGGGVHYTILATPRLAVNHRLQPALKKCAEAAAKALQDLEPGMPT